MMKIPYLISIILFILGIGLLFYQINLGIASIIISLIVSLVQYWLQRKSDEQRHKEYVHIASLIYDSSQADKKIESLKELIKKKNIDVKKIIQKFDKPLYSIFIYKFNEVPRGSKKDSPKPLTELMTKEMKFQLVGNSFYMLLPKDMPSIKKGLNIEKWARECIISKLPKGTTYTLNFVALVDIRKIFCHKTVDWGNTVFDVLAKDKTFLVRLLESLPKEKIRMKEIIEDYSIADIVTLKLDKSIIKLLDENSQTILSNLNCSNVTDLYQVPEDNLKQELSKYIEENLNIVVDNLVRNSRALMEVS